MAYNPIDNRVFVARSLSHHMPCDCVTADRKLNQFTETKRGPLMEQNCLFRQIIELNREDSGTHAQLQITWRGGSPAQTPSVSQLSIAL